ncbi:DUF1293 family protein [Vibrio hannami]|uniref:DUF1293 family protein n=1 Tax=Vibrio hannami TaxID=2717094 RepID=UPI00240EDDEF|nr:DUF1293 family protein [Vibrio hannami]MDG3085467.1 DUF1293 family protein [Vibrio hannami]
MSVLIANITRRKFAKSNAFESFVKLMHPVSNVENDKITIQAIGVTTDLPFGRQEIFINDAYAAKLIERRCFAPLRNYEVKTALNPETLQNEIVELIPVDDDVKKLFAESLKG